jgi:predicted AAA+ superfamily ATPase
MKIERKKLLSRTTNSIKRYPVTLLIGPRQCGKTTLANEIFDAMGGHYFDLEDPETPLKPEIAKLILKDLKGLVVIDEFQRQPELFTLIRVLADRKPLPARFLILGSASPILVRGVSESLAGRVSYIRMSGFSLDEISPAHCDTLWIRGGFPLSFLAEDNQMSYEWRSNFIQTFLERDIPQLGIRIPASTLRRFWMMLAHYHGQLWNSAVLARSLGSKEDTARKYLDILTGAFLVRQLPPWFENIGKRLVKAPKVYIRDMGILHTLQGIKDKLQLQSHPNLGFSWEGFALEQVIEMTNSEEEVYFYKTHGGAELDGLLVRNGKRYGFEFKYEDSPKSNKSMHIVSQDLGLHRLWVIYPGTQTYPLSGKIEVVPLTQLRSLLEKHKLVDRL